MAHRSVADGRRWTPAILNNDADSEASAAMARPSIALFLVTAGLVAGAAACGKAPGGDGGEGASGMTAPVPAHSPATPATKTPQKEKGGEGGEGGEN
jgi:hypothetical protein